MLQELAIISAKQLAISKQVYPLLMSNESNESNNDTCISKGKDKNMGYVLIQGKYWANREAAVQRQGLHRVCPHVEARRAPPLHRPPKRLLRPQVLTRRGRRRLPPRARRRSRGRREVHVLHHGALGRGARDHARGGGPRRGVFREAGAVVGSGHRERGGLGGPGMSGFRHPRQLVRRGRAAFLLAARGTPFYVKRTAQLRGRPI